MLCLEGKKDNLYENYGKTEGNVSYALPVSIKCGLR